MASGSSWSLSPFLSRVAGGRRPRRAPPRPAVGATGAVRARRGLCRAAGLLPRLRPRPRRPRGRPDRGAAPAHRNGPAGRGRDQEHGGPRIPPSPRHRACTRRDGRRAGPEGSARRLARRHGAADLDNLRFYQEWGSACNRSSETPSRRKRRCGGHDDRRHRAPRPDLARSAARRVDETTHRERDR
jgi:hypothetical protein